jgi:two-component system, LytTR family, sensor kinase
MQYKTATYHVLTWMGIYLLWLMIFHSYSVQLSRTITIQFCYLIFIMADYYSISLYIIPKYLSVGKNVLFIFSIITLILISAILRTSLAVYMSRHYFDDSHPPDINGLYLTSLLNISAWVLIITVSKMLVDRMNVQQKLSTLEKERINSELNYLKAQINPHALFNSLNTIYGHIDKQNKNARNILLQFSGLLRYQLYDCNGHHVKLEREIQFVKDYVNFQRLRKDDRLVVKIDASDVNQELYIAPLLLIVLIENAFKFVSNYNDGRENLIEIKLRTNKNEFVCSLYNTCDEYTSLVATNTCGGIGIQNLKRRLDLLYPDRFELTSNAQKEYYETTLKIDL